jgi:hypothetical protein
MGDYTVIHSFNKLIGLIGGAMTLIFGLSPVYGAASYSEALEKYCLGCMWSVNGDTYAGIQWNEKSMAKPSKATLDALRTTVETERQNAECVAHAKKLLADSDWTVAADSPLTNKTEWLTYRASLYNLIKTPVAKPSYPVAPTLKW